MFALLMLAVLSIPALAADITVRTDRDPVAQGETFRIIFTVDGSQDDEPDFSPLNQDFQLLGTSQSSSFSIINGSMSRSKTYTLTVAPNRKGKLTIPSINFGKDKSPVGQITITDAGQSGSGSSQSPDVPTTSSKQLFMIAEVDSKNPYVQEQVILTLKIYRRIEWTNPSLSDPKFEGVEAVIQSLGKEKNYEAEYKGQRYAVIELRYAIFPQQSGELTIQPFNLKAKIPTGTTQRRSPSRSFNDSFFDDFFSRSRQTYAIKSTNSKAIKLDVKAIPASFKGQHWLPAKKIQLQETWSSDVTKLVAGEPVTRTIALIADGLGASQLPEIKSADQKGLRSYPDQPVAQEQATGSGLLSTVTQKIALIPSHDGQFTIPAIEIPWWNTTADKMELAKIPAQTLIAIGSVPSAIANTQNIATNVLPPGADTETAQTPPTSQPNQQTIPYQWLLIASGILLFLWLATTAAWLSNRRKMPAAKADNPEETIKVSLRRALKALKNACQSKQPETTRDALIRWGKAAWPKQPPNSLEEIATRVSPTLATEINNLSRALYSSEQANWNAGIILEFVKKFNTAAQNTTRDKHSDLEPLYR